MSNKPQFFTRYQLVEFGNYLLSKERREAYSKNGDQIILEERLSVVNHADVENYITDLFSKDQNDERSVATGVDSN